MMPENQTKDFILETLKVDGLDLSDFKNPVRDFDLPGGYRKMLTQGKDVSWELVKHKDISDDLIHSRLELFQAGDNKDSLRKIGDADGPMTSLLLRMSLDTSCYATMALREIMRVQTDIRSLKYGDEEEKAEELENQDSENTGVDDSLDDAADNSNGVNDEAKRKLEETGDIHTKKDKNCRIIVRRCAGLKCTLYIQINGVFFGTGISCKEKLRKENFQMCLSLSFHD